MRCQAIFVVALISLIGGCSPYRGLRTDMASQAIEDYNTVQADTQSTLLARNILRAKDRMPRHFTGLGTGQVVQQTTAGIGPFVFTDDRSPINIGTSAVPEFNAFALFKRSASLGLNVQSTPRIDLAALDSKEFITGMTSTVRYDVLHYFQRQGWPPHLMMMLFVRELQLGPDTYSNYPGNPSEFRKFVDLTRRLAQAGLSLKVASRPPKADEYLGPTMCLDQAGQLEFQVTAAQQGLKLFAVKDDTSCAGKPRWGLGKAASDNYWSFDACRLLPDGEASSSLELMFRSQIEAAWKSALERTVVTKDDGINKVLTAWRDHIDTANVKCGDALCATKPISSLGDYVKIRGVDRYKVMCGNLKNYQSIREGLCETEWDTSGTCSLAASTSAAEVSLNASAKAATFAITGKALLRSPESIIYYLGQIVRAQDDVRLGKSDPIANFDDGLARYWAKTNGDAQEFSLMSLMPIADGAAKKAAVLTVEYGGETYGVVQDSVACPLPWSNTNHGAYGCDRSMTVFNAVLMLIGLQRSATELPTTPTVNVIGGG